MSIYHMSSQRARRISESTYSESNGFVEVLIGYYESQPIAMIIFYPSFSNVYR